MEIESVDDRLSRLEAEMDSVVGRVNDSALHLQALDRKLDQIHDDLLELISLWRSAKGFARIVKWTGIAVRWAVGIGATIGLAWATFSKGAKF